jgi:hypothetical protein
VNITISADVVAWYAAIIGTGSLAVSALNVWRDRPRIKVSADAGNRVHGVSAYSPDKLYISVTVANRGRRPVTISKVWFDTRNHNPERGPHMLLSDSFLQGAREVAEGKATHYLMDQTDIDLNDLTRVVVADLTGRTWSGKLRKA